MDFRRAIKGIPRVPAQDALHQSASYPSSRDVWTDSPVGSRTRFFTLEQISWS